MAMKPCIFVENNYDMNTEYEIQTLKRRCDLLESSYVTLIKNQIIFLVCFLLGLIIGSLL